jgi:uncharacterized repeat protein (TIGR01451 family)
VLPIYPIPEVCRRPRSAAQQTVAAATTATGGAGQTGTAILPQLGGTTLTPGVYNGGALDLTGDLTLDGPGVYIITASSSLTTATGSSVNLINGANPCDVFWQVSSSANLLGASFSGTIMALTSITAGDGVIVNGRLLARNGDVTLINDVINRPACGGVVHTPGISVTKTCPASAKIGDTITYRITVVNTGDEPLSGLTVSDPLISPLPLRGFPSTLPVGASAPRTFTYVVTGPPGTIHNVVTAQAMGASSGAAASGTSSCDTAATATRLRPPKANFIGPCGEPYYAALFTNNTSAAVTFTWSFVSYYSHDIIRITRTVAAGEEFQTSFHHVLASTRMRITAGGKILASIRSAPSGNYGPCPNGAAPVSAQGERDGQI